MEPGHTGEVTALFHLDGETLVPTELARGPWDPRALHGGPTAAAVTRAVEAHLRLDASHQAWSVARLTLELVRPVPVEALTVTTRTARPGRKVTLIEAVVAAGSAETVVARAVVMAIRQLPVEVADASAEVLGPPAVAPATSPPAGSGGWKGFHNGAVEMRWETGTWERLGPATVWMRLAVPVVEGELASPTVTAAALADFGNGISAELDFGSWRFLNPELTVHLARPPQGQWVRLAARTRIGSTGMGLAESTLADRAGVFGRAAQSLLVEPG